MNEIFIKKCTSYSLDEIKNAIIAGFDELGGIDKFIQQNEKVLLKPNSLQPSKPEAAIVTHPIFIKAVIQVLKEKTDRIYIGESPGIGNFSTSAAISGLKKIIDEEKVKLIEFVADKEIEIKDKLVLGKFKVDKRLLEMDKIINLPKLKTHTLMQMTLCVKNMFGIIPGLKKLEYHLKANQDRMHFAKILLDVYRAMPPHFNIVDGILAMEGDGPGTGGIPVNLGIIIMGENGLAIDRVIPELVGVDPFRIWTNKIYKEYINNNNDIKYRVLGDNAGVIKKFIMPPNEMHTGLFGHLIGVFRNFTLSKPVFIKEKCINCMICVKNCPANALIYIPKNSSTQNSNENYKSELDNNVKVKRFSPLSFIRNFIKRKNKFQKDSLHKDEETGIICDYNKCIRCFCCHELCPGNAILIKKPFLRVFSK